MKNNRIKYDFGGQILPPTCDNDNGAVAVLVMQRPSAVVQPLAVVRVCVLSFQLRQLEGEGIAALHLLVLIYVNPAFKVWTMNNIADLAFCQVQVNGVMLVEMPLDA